LEEIRENKGHVKERKVHDQAEPAESVKKTEIALSLLLLHLKDINPFLFVLLLEMDGPVAFAALRVIGNRMV
jgi:hypothetical protein